MLKKFCNSSFDKKHKRSKLWYRATYRLVLPSHFSLYLIIQSKNIYRDIGIYIYMQYTYTEFVSFSWRGEKLTLYSIPFLSSTFGIAHNSALTSLLLPSGLCTRDICKRELATRRAAAVTQISQNFYQTIRCCAPLPMRIMHRHEPFVSGKSIEHVDRKRSSIWIFLLEHKIV